MIVSGGQLSLLWLIRLRYAAAVGELLIALIAFYAFGFLGDRLPIFILIGLSFTSNFALHTWLGRSEGSIERLIGSALLLDMAILTGLLYYSGGPANPFSILYLVHVSLAGVILGQWWCWIAAIVSSALFGLLFIISEPTPMNHMMHGDHSSYSSHLQGMWFSFVIAASLIAYFQTRLLTALKRHQISLQEFREQAAREEHLASIATLAAGAAHEISTPLGTIAIAAEALEHELKRLGDRGELLEDATLIRSQINRCREILDRMSGRASDGDLLELERLTLEELVLKLNQELTAEDVGRLEIQLAEPLLTFNVRTTLLIQTLTSLIKNGIEASQERQIVTLRFERAGGELLISVIDHGIGIEEEVRRRVGEPFFTTKEPGRGMGFGVFLARSYIERSGGSLKFAQTAGGGTTVNLKLPLFET